MRVMHLLSSSNFSGAENVVCQIVSSFSNDSSFSFVYCSPNGPISKVLKSKEIEFYPLNSMSLKEIKKAIISVKPDLIHAHDMNASFLASLVCSGIPIVSHIHNNAISSRRVSLKSIAFLLSSNKYKHIFWVSEDAQNGYVFRRFLASKSSVLNNIVNVDGIVQKANVDECEDHYDIAFLGRMNEIKNPFRALKICEDIIHQKDDVRCIFIGNGALLEDLRNYVCKHDIDGYIQFTGYLENPYRILKKADCLLMTSKYEGLPMAVLEAAALGKPVISTPVDGVRGIITNGINGFVSDDDALLEKFIVNLIGDSNLYAEMSKNQQLFSEEWNNVEKYNKSIKDIYSYIGGKQ